MLELLQRMDTNTLELVHHYTQNYVFDRIMPFITSLGNLGMIWIIISIVLLLNKKYKNIGLMCLTALILDTIIGEGILKHLIQRPRPFVSMPAIHLLIAKPTSFSFPSGHTSASFAAVGVIWSQLRKYRMHAILLASLISFSRLYLFVHYPSDVLAGIIQGLICAKIVLIYYPLTIGKSASAYTNWTQVLELARLK